MCLVSIKGIKANPDKIKAIVHVRPPQSRKEVQKPIDRIAALNRFMSKLAHRSLPFFTVLRRLQRFLVGSRTTKGLQ
jgi:hypothetical protein